MLKSSHSSSVGRLLKILALVLGSALFIPVSCTFIEIGLVKLDRPFETVEPMSSFYPSFFRIAIQSEGKIEYEMLKEHKSLKTAYPDYSFLLPNPPALCESFICYQILSDSGTEQIIEVAESPDSLFAIKVWSRYKATLTGFTPISLRKLSMNSMYYAFACSLLLYGIGKILRKKISSQDTALSESGSAG